MPSQVAPALGSLDILNKGLQALEPRLGVRFPPLTMAAYKRPLEVEIPLTPVLAFLFTRVVIEVRLTLGGWRSSSEMGVVVQAAAYPRKGGAPIRTDMGFLEPSGEAKGTGLTASALTNILTAGASKMNDGTNMKRLAELRAQRKSADRGDTYNRRMLELNRIWNEEVILAALSILRDEGCEKIRSNGNQITGLYQGLPFKVTFYTPAVNQKQQVEWELGDRADHHLFTLLSMSPMNVASEALFKHFHGFLV